MANLNLDDDFVPFWSSKNGRKYFFHNGKKGFYHGYYHPWKKYANPGTLYSILRFYSYPDVLLAYNISGQFYSSFGASVIYCYYY